MAEPAHLPLRRPWRRTIWPALCAVLWLPLSLAAQNQADDGPAPAIVAAQSRVERVRQELNKPIHRPIRQYLDLPAAVRFGPLGRLQADAATHLSRVQALLAILRDTTPESAATAAPPERNDLIVSLENLEVRLRARLLVEQLGAREWPRRNQAAVALDHLGRQALPELTWGLASPDPEIAEACLRLLIPIRGRGYIGISFVILPPALTTEEAARKGLPFLGGVEVDMVQEGLPGANAGLKAGDIIIALGPYRIGNWSDLLRAVDRLGPEVPTLISYVREGKIATVPLTLGTRPDNIN